MSRKRLKRLLIHTASWLFVDIHQRPLCRWSRVLVPTGLWHYLLTYLLTSTHCNGWAGIQRSLTARLEFLRITSQHCFHSVISPVVFWSGRLVDTGYVKRHTVGSLNWCYRVRPRRTDTADWAATFRSIQAGQITPGPPRQSDPAHNAVRLMRGAFYQLVYWPPGRVAQGHCLAVRHPQSHRTRSNGCRTSSHCHGPLDLVKLSGSAVDFVKMKPQTTRNGYKLANFKTGSENRPIVFRSAERYQANKVENIVEKSYI